MPKTKFTPRAVAKLPAPDPTGKQTVYSDPRYPGLGVVVSGTTPRKTWVMLGSLQGKTLKITISDVPPKVSQDEFDKVWNQVQQMRAKVRAGVHPSADANAKPATGATPTGATPTSLEQIYAQHRQTNAWKKLSRNSQKLYAGAWENYLGPDFAQVPLVDLKPEQIVNAHRKWAKRSHGQARFALLLLKAMVKSARIYGWVSRDWANPLEFLSDLLPGWNTVKVKPGTLTFQQAGDLLSRMYRQMDVPLHPTFVKNSNPALIAFAMFTGLRATEVHHLKWAEIDIANGTLHLASERTKQRRGHTAPLSSQAHDLLTRLRASEGTLRSDYVFGHKVGRRSYPAQNQNRFLRLMGDVVGYEKGNLSMHRLRHLFAALGDSTCGIENTQRLMGHAPRTVLERHYLDPSNIEHLRPAAQGIGDKLEALAGVNVVPLHGSTSVGAGER